jgi:hypothetical protein
MTVTDNARVDQMRRALRACSFPPATAAKRFARQVCEMPIDKVSPAQWLTVVVLAHRFRRQMPDALVPTDGELAVARDLLAKIKAGREADQQARRDARSAKRAERCGAPDAMPLLERSGA